MNKSISLKAAALSLVLLALFIGAWQLATQTVPKPIGQLTEYERLMGKGVEKNNGIPTPLKMVEVLKQQLSHPFYDLGPNNKGIGLQLAYSLGRVVMGFLIAAAVAIPLGFLIGMSPLWYRALNPFIQILKPISPLAWMPIALYTLRDAPTSAIFVIFICSVWPMLINTAFGVASVRPEWLNVARTLELGPFRTAFKVILPAAAPTILTGMRISMGIAWLVIVAAEMLVGGTGVGYFLWNQWNNLFLPNVIMAIMGIGLVGMALDLSFAGLQKLLTYRE